MKEIDAAIEALEKFAVYGRIGSRDVEVGAAISALAGLRSLKEQGPVAWEGLDLDGMYEAFSRVTDAQGQKHPFHSPLHQDAMLALRELRHLIPKLKSYTHPAPEAKEKPFGYVSRTGHGTFFRETISPEHASLTFGGKKIWTPVYTHPETDEETDCCWKCGEDGGTSCGAEHCGLLEPDENDKYWCDQYWKERARGFHLQRYITELEAKNTQLLEACKAALSDD